MICFPHWFYLKAICVGTDSSRDTRTGGGGIDVCNPVYPLLNISTEKSLPNIFILISLLQCAY